MLLGRIEDRPRYRYHNDLQFFIKHPLNITPSSQNTSLQTSPFSPPQTPPESQLQPRHPSIHPSIHSGSHPITHHSHTHTQTHSLKITSPFQEGISYPPSRPAACMRTTPPWARYPSHSARGFRSLAMSSCLNIHVIRLTPPFSLSLPLKTVPTTPSQKPEPKNFQK